MTDDKVQLVGRHVRLEPLEVSHADPLAKASAGGDDELYRWSPVPRSKDEARKYIETAVSWREAGTAVPFAVVQRYDGKVIGSSRFFLIERWAWPEWHERYGREAPDACEIGYTWYAPSAIRTAANTESKLLMLTHAFECWKALRVCFHTDARNTRSQAALERIGAKREGLLRAHRMAADFIARDSVRFSIVAAEWPSIKERLTLRLQNNW
jgi:RimJ/RimL family protein N-acetyltransferase